MPELPDVETLKRYLDSTALHKTIQAVDVSSTQVLKGISGQEFAKRLKGRKLSKTRRHGKHLGVKLDSGEWLMLHFGMTGDLQYFQDGEAPKYTRIRFDLKNGYSLAYISLRQLGKNRLVDDFDAFIEDTGLGIDALDEQLTVKAFRELVADRRGTVKGFLMNQKIVAGIGNEYADEILFQCGFRPDRKIERLDDKEVKSLYRNMKRVLKTAVDRNSDVSRYPKSWLRTRREKNASCPKCGKPIKTKEVSGRTTYYCPHCQR